MRAFYTYRHKIQYGLTLISSISGIRGTIGGEPGKNLTPPDILKFTSAFASVLKEGKERGTVVVGRDGRVSGHMVQNLVVGALLGMGLDVMDLGLSTTPTVEMAVQLEEAALGGIIITASHNPREWNALKLLGSNGEFIDAAAGQEVVKRANEGNFDYVGVNQIGQYEERKDYLDIHIQKILELPLVDADLIKEKNFKIAVDGINSSGAFAVPQLLRALGVSDIREINNEINGVFAHKPEPLPENMSAIMQLVKAEALHLGIVVDPDVDRLALVCDDGEPLGEEYTLVAVSDYILQNNPGPTVSNLSSTRALKEVTEKKGCDYHASAVGEVNVVAKMKEVGAVIGGEGNGGVIYPDLHHGRDALVGIALFLTHLAKWGKSSSMLRSTYPQYNIYKSKIDLNEGLDVDAVLEKLQEKYKNQPMNTIDGLKLYFDEDWIHMRKSNTEPIVRVYAETTHETTASNLVDKLRSDVREISKELKLSKK